MEKTKLRLKIALLDILNTKTFDEIKVNEICEKALIHKTTFYNHFDDKYDLLNYVITSIHEEIKANLSLKKGIKEYYLSIAKEYIKIIKKNKKLFDSVLSTKGNISTYMIYEIYVQDLEKEISKVKTINLPNRYIASFYVTAVFSLLNEWYINGCVENEETLISYLNELIIDQK